MKEMTTAQICARMREIREHRKFHHNRKPKAQKREQCYESTMAVGGCRKVKGGYKTAKELLQAYEQQEYGELENRRQMFEAGKGTRFTKRVHVNTGAHYTKSGGVTSTKRPTAQGEVSGCGSVITLKRFPGSRLTCVCKSRKIY